MQVEFLDKRIFVSVNVEAQPGHFALEDTPLKWENCRERFHKAFIETTDGFYFKHHPGQSCNVASFILKTESILNESIFSRFAETNRDTIMWIEPSKFWKCCQMRRSLLTILLRCGMLYELDKDNYEEALFKQEFIVPTKRAVMRFLYGFTKYFGPDLTTNTTVQISGWKAIFEAKNEADIKQMLVWPTDNPYTPSIELTSSLWH